MLLLLLQVLTQELEFLQITPSRHGPITLVSAPGPLTLMSFSGEQ